MLQILQTALLKRFNISQDVLQIYTSYLKMLEA